jgi:hypothetical protein
VAQYLWLLAPILAPTDLASDAGIANAETPTGRSPNRGEPSGLRRVISAVLWPSVSGSMQRLYDFELEPEVRDWLDSISDSDFKRVDEVCGMLAEKGTELGGPWSDHLDGPVWELRIRLRDVAARITYWCTAEGTIVLLTVFRKTRQHDQKQIDRAVRAQKACERDHRGPVTETYERQVR